MITLVFEKSFKRSYQKRVRPNLKLRQKFSFRIKLFCENPFHPLLKTHKLSGKLKNLWAFVVDYDCRVIFKFIQGDKALLIDIGTHEEVY